MAGKPQQDRRIQKNVPESQTPQGAYPECDKAGDEQCPHWSNQQQDQVDHPQGIRLSKHTKYAGYVVPCMLGFEAYTSQPKIKGHLISINTGIADKKHPPLPLKSHKQHLIQTSGQYKKSCGLFFRATKNSGGRARAVFQAYSKNLPKFRWNDGRSKQKLIKTSSRANSHKRL